MPVYNIVYQQMRIETFSVKVETKDPETARMIYETNADLFDKIELLESYSPFENQDEILRIEEVKEDE